MSDVNTTNLPDENELDPGDIEITLNESMPDDDEPNARQTRKRIDLDSLDDLSSVVEAASRVHTAKNVTEPAEEEFEEESPISFASQPIVLDATLDDLASENPISLGSDKKLLREIESLKTELKSSNENYLRAVADLQNFRRRGEEERRRLEREGNERLIKELLPVLDDFDRAVEFAKEAKSFEQLITGVEAILRKFSETMEKQGVTPIAAVGEKFDPDYHEAVMLDEESDQPDETITVELRRGYLMNDRVIRPSLVKVAKS
jgi:molecular chaperone GrpE